MGGRHNIALIPPIKHKYTHQPKNGPNRRSFQLLIFSIVYDFSYGFSLYLYGNEKYIYIYKYKVNILKKYLYN